MQIQFEGPANKSDNYYLILDVGGTLCKICLVEIKNNSNIYLFKSLNYIRRKFASGYFASFEQFMENQRNHQIRV